LIDDFALWVRWRGYSGLETAGSETGKSGFVRIGMNGIHPGSRKPFCRRKQGFGNCTGSPFLQEYRVVTDYYCKNYSITDDADGSQMALMGWLVAFAAEWLRR
jgi:hypothetical protein